MEVSGYALYDRLDYVRGAERAVREEDMRGEGREVEGDRQRVRAKRRMAIAGARPGERGGYKGARAQANAG